MSRNTEAIISETSRNIRLSNMKEGDTDILVINVTFHTIPVRRGLDTIKYQYTNEFVILVMNVIIYSKTSLIL